MKLEVEAMDEHEAVSLGMLINSPLSAWLLQLLSPI
jgi:hypothetical protein